MHREAHYWYSPRLGREMGVVVFGHFGPPMIAFPTTGGDDWEYERQGVIGAMAGAIGAGRVKVFCVNTNNGDSFGNERAHPRHRSYMQAQYDDYIVQEVMPFVRGHCRSHDIGMWAMGASLGGYHAANTILKHPDVVKRCFALSGVYDMRRFMSGDYDDNFYFNNPVDYLQGLADPWFYEQLRSCDIRLVTGNGPFENSGPSYHLSHILRSKGIAHSVDDWGPLGGHEWPYWKHQMRQYLNEMY
jgi:esterase/lipase superfamily enzyme